MNLPASNAIKIDFETLRQIDTATIPIAPTWIAMGTPLAFPARMNIVNNFSDQTVFISIDGVNPHMVIASQSAMVLDWSSNKSNQGGLAVLPANTQFYLSVTGAATGGLFISSIYANDK